MSSLPPEPAAPGQSANEALAAQLIARLREAGLLPAENEAAAYQLLTAGRARPGEWPRLLAATT